MQNEKFSLRGRAKSFAYAGKGISRFLRNEHNAWIHSVATVAVLIAAICFRISWAQAAVLALATGLVWVAEMLNTCLERAMDLISREQHPQIEFIKDLAAGAVLVASLTAAVVGFFIFVPYIVYTCSKFH